MRPDHPIPRYILLFITALWTTSVVQAQFVADYKRTAGIYFSQGDYYAAAQYYERYLDMRQKRTEKGNYKP